jgi:hypothetical protein
VIALDQLANVKELIDHAVRRNVVTRMMTR